MARRRKVLQSFVGNYEITVLSGYRIVLPAPFRGILDTKVVITRGIDTNLYLFETNRWETLIAPLTKRSLLNSKVRALLRYLVAHAFILDVDSQGRVVIPASLRDFGSEALEVGDQLIVAGLYNWVEIWRREDWHRSLEKLTRDVADIADVLDEVSSSQ